MATQQNTEHRSAYEEFKELQKRGWVGLKRGATATILAVAGVIASGGSGSPIVQAVGWGYSQEA